MKKALMGSVLAVAGMALAFFAERFGEHYLWALIPGLGMFLIGSGMVMSFKDQVIQMAAKHGGSKQQK